ncbi:MAG: XTP/dITP diphosphatase [Firmicutes bacterium]|nr:XTP/dITP diphosphatase [Bacillota bacterium]
MKLVLATRNSGKVKEMADLLESLNIEVVSMDAYPDVPEVEEDGATFLENAVKKAKATAAATGEVALADDSGLEVDYLDGLPGVHSARFAGEPKDDRANNEKLLTLLEGVPPEKRAARFRCVIAVATPGGEVYTTEGTCEGIIIDEPRGDKGFGYDPLFYLPEFGKTFAELNLAVKNKISHRGKAVARALGIVAKLASGRK